MDETSYGLIVEGPSDEGVFSELIRKIASPDVTVIVRPCGGIPRLKRLFPGLLRDLEHVRQGKPVDKALVVRDSDGGDPGSLEQDLAQKVNTERFAFPRGIQFCVVRRETETLLLADANAINLVATERGGRSVPPIQGQLEEIVDPKQRLSRLLLQAKLPHNPEVCRQIARHSNLEVLRYRCPSFRSFEQKVLDC